MVRIAVAGDTHGRIEKLTRAMNLLKPDYLFFTGDFYDDGVKLARRLKLKWIGVMGNCDFARQGNQEQQIDCGGRKFYLVHGHQYGVKRSLNALLYRGQEVGADLVLFGHTHVPCCEQVEDIWLINPGSASLPRIDCNASYAVIDINKNNLEARIIEL